MFPSKNREVWEASHDSFGDIWSIDSLYQTNEWICFLENRWRMGIGLNKGIQYFICPQNYRGMPPTPPSFWKETSRRWGKSLHSQWHPLSNTDFPLDRRNSKRLVYIETTNLGPRKLRDFKKELVGNHYRNTFHLIMKNSNHLCNDIYLKLTGNPIPHWVNWFARIGLWRLWWIFGLEKIGQPSV